MALDAELSNLKSAGTYRFERDLSTISNDTTVYSNLRLVVGFSKIGPFNTPILVTNTAQFIKLYGPIDRSLEKRGSFFHRSCLVALSAGPILCLNLLNLDPDLDQVTQKSFSVNTKYYNKPLVSLPLISIYDTDKFWFASEESYLDSINRYLSLDATTHGTGRNILTIDNEDEGSEKENYLDPKYNGRYNGEHGYADDILHFTNVGKKPVSILVKKASSYATTNYECTLNEWYGEENVPEYLNGTSYVSDYMVEVYVIGGDFGPAYEKPLDVATFVDLDDDGDVEIIKRYDVVNGNPYERFTSDIVYQNYFDKNGFIRKESPNDTTDTKLARFLNLASVNLLGKYTGSLIPNFVTKFGQNIWIQKLVNDDTTVNGVFCVENVEKLEEVEEIDGVINENIDIIGNNIPAMLKKYNGEEIDFEFLSYKTTIKAPKQKLYFAVEFKHDAGQVIEDLTRDGYAVYERAEGQDTVELSLGDSGDTVKLYAWELKEFCVESGVYKGHYTPENDQIELPGNETANLSDFLSPASTTSGDLTKTLYTYENHFAAGVLPNKVKVLNSGETGSEDGGYEEVSGLVKIENIVNETGDVDIPNPLITEISVFADDRVKFGGNTYELSDLHTTAKLNSPLMTVRGNEIMVPAGANIVAGDYIISSYGREYDEVSDTYGDYTFSRLTRVVETRAVYADTSLEGEEAIKLTKVAVKVVCADIINKEEDGELIKTIKKFKTVDQFADHFQWICLKGYQLRDELMPNSTNERQNEILDVLRESPKFTNSKSNLYKTLCDRDYIQWRYLVDTFGGGIEEECKNVYTLLCQGRQSALALINCPSQVEFKKSQDPSFVNKRNSVEAEFIAKGGDSAKTPSFLFSLPKLENGASFGAYYYPFLKISDLSAPKSVPPAAYVSNLYMAKYNSANAWSIVAGQRRGVISGNQVIGVEATLVHDNRDWLEPVGINAIIWENGVGVEVYANKTAKQNPKSALSSIHVREACIYIQDNVEQILRKYVFEMNTAQTRLEIKTLVDNFLETVKADNGVYDYKTVMDTSNNTPEVIDNNMGVIDIYIEPVRGLEILAQRLTVMKTGGIAAGAFN